MNSCLYAGVVTHQRVRPKRHRLRYRVFSAFLDLDELPRLHASLRLLAYNRAGLLSFFDRDHGPGRNVPLRPWVEEQLARAGIDLAGGRVCILCYPRLLGFVFNPLSVYFCYRADGVLTALLYEVNNTFGERHSYLIPVSEADGLIRQECDKRFYVSPFIRVDGRYRFRVTPPGERLSIGITQMDANGTLMHAAFEAERQTLDDRTLAVNFVRYPLMTLKVVGGIHWEALKLWRKGVPIVRRPSPPSQPVTIVTPRI
jgi:uncharacterized protein